MKDNIFDDDALIRRIKDCALTEYENHEVPKAYAIATIRGLIGHGYKIIIERDMDGKKYVFEPGEEIQ